MHSEADSDKESPRGLGASDYLLIIRERWLVGVLAGLVLAGGVMLYTLTRTPEYTASLQLLVGISRDKVLDMDQVVDQVEMARSGKADSVLKQHMLEMYSRKFREYLINSLSQAEIERIIAAYRSPALPRPEVGEVLQQALSVGLNARDMIYTVSATHRVPKVAAEIANLYALKYIDYTLSDVGSSNASALSFLRQNAEKMQQSNLDGKKALQRVREVNQIISVDDSRRIAIEKIGTLSAERAQMVSERRKHEVVLEQLRARGIDNDKLADDRLGAFLEIEEIVSFGSIRTLKAQLDAAVLLQREIDLVYLERHPKYIENQDRINDLKARLRGELALARNSVVTSIDKLDARIAKHSADIAALSAEIQRLDELAIGYGRLESKVANDEKTLKRVEERLNETIISTQLSKANMRIIDLAAEPYVPSSPNRKNAMMGAGFLFLVGLAGLPIGLYFVNDKLTSPADVEDFVGKPLLGEVIELKRKQVPNLPRLVSSGQDASMVDAFRSIYNTIKLNTRPNERKIQVVTSTIPEEGKTMFCLNYAAVIAQHGSRVLLIDCDLRKPRIQEYMGMARGAGLVTWYNNGADLSETGKLHELLGIIKLDSGAYLLPAGKATNRSTELVESVPFRHLLQHLATEFDHIVIDSPPLGVFPDAMFLASYAQDVVYIVRWNKVSRRSIKGVIEQLDKTSAHVCGVVINRRKQGGRQRGYHGYNYDLASKYKKKYYASPE